MELDQRPLLSIITVCLNDLQNLKSTLASIRSQTYPFIEMILIDGGSTDGTIEFIQTSNDLINYWSSEPDKGLYDAMNKGILQAKGDYILFLNAGDTFHNSHVAEYAMANSGQSDVLYGDAIIINKNQSYQGLRHKKLPETLFWKNFSQGMVVCHQAMMVKRSIALPYNLNYKISSDIDWAIRCLKKAKTIKNLGIFICDFQSGGLSDRKRSLALMERWHILNQHFGFWHAFWSHVKIISKYLTGTR